MGRHEESRTEPYEKDDAGIAKEVSRHWRALENIMAICMTTSTSVSFTDDS